MTDGDSSAEIERLREQLAELRREREAAARGRSRQAEAREAGPREAGAQAAREAAAETGAGTASGEESDAGGSSWGVEEVIEDLGHHVKDLLETLDEDLKTARPSTLLIVFALGVLVGRLR